ncbi:uncharacterized protein LOC115631682 isoform X2 [Scaptodrosophila lebanonensis]|uniref:Uncharacterized protein LOC115622101 isoform X2 n=1 Tax=Drosophila lebanonensis TaxID=7225 RepID=A0A6J2UA57_DROLE|nr:uncharacterized protein LOC115622101 isoform X2 [Scaptodrosophila lebanonensis]XP_030384358.1 uncharacterized protein LOC115631682 isoform X2 [Scaptodrosophila lebanonensis]
MTNPMDNTGLEHLSIHPKNHTKYISELVRLHVEYTKKAPIYCRNSMDHRIKLRIGLFLLRIGVIRDKRSLWEENWWDLVLAQFDELNVKMIYETFVAKWVSFKSLTDRLSKLQEEPPNFQLSIISVAHYFCRLYDDMTDILPIFNLLWDQTKDTIADIRRFALLGIYTWIEEYERSEEERGRSIEKLVKEYEKLGKWTQPIIQQLKEEDEKLGKWRQQIIQELGEEWEDHRAKEIRLCLNPISKNVIEDIFYMTFGPFEECKISDDSKFSNNIKKWHEFYKEEARRMIAFPNAEEDLSAISSE